MSLKCFLRSFLLGTLVSSPVWAFPVPEPEAAPSENIERDLVTREVTPLSAEDISSYTPFTQFARAAYCGPTVPWTCGGEYFHRFISTPHPHWTLIDN
jgi:hypothetical protein